MDFDGGNSCGMRLFTQCEDGCVSAVAVLHGREMVEAGRRPGERVFRGRSATHSASMANVWLVK